MPTQVPKVAVVVVVVAADLFDVVVLLLVVLRVRETFVWFPCV
jgi:hypothetical protein